MQVRVEEPFGWLMLTGTCDDAGFDVAVIGLRICAVVGEHARCELMPGAGRKLGGVWGVRGTVWAEGDWESEG